MSARDVRAPVFDRPADETTRRCHRAVKSRAGVGLRLRLLLCLALPWSTLIGQSEFSFPAGEVPRLFLPGYVEEVDYDKLLIGSTYWFDFSRCTPSAPCEDGNGNLITHTADGHFEVGAGGSWWGATLSPWHAWGTCGICSSIQGNWQFSFGDPAFVIKPGWAPGVRNLRLRMLSTNAQFSVTSDTRTVRFVLPGVVELGIKKFDVLDEKALCLGSDFTSRFTVFNWGELDATDVLVEVWVAEDKAMTVNPQLVTSLILPETIPAGESAGLTFEHTDVLPGFAKGLRYFAARVLWNPSDNDPPPQGDMAQKQAPPDKVSVLADFKFTGKGLHWGSPAGSPAKVFPGQECKLQYSFKNIGRVDTEADSVIQVQLKKSNAPWSVIAEIPVPVPVSCHSEDELSGVVSFVLPTDDPEAPGHHPYVEVGKQRGLRLVFQNGGVSTDGLSPLVEETKLGNNKSKVKLLKIVPVPAIELTLERGAWPPSGLPEGRRPGSLPGDPGNSVLVTATLEEGGPPRRIRFWLEAVSAEPGVCMNYGADVDADHFLPDARFRKQPGVNDAFDEPSAYDEIDTTEETQSISVEVTSFDFATFAAIRAQALDEEGEPIGDLSDPMTLIDDENGNRIADQWEALWPSLSTADPSWDEELGAYPLSYDGGSMPVMGSPGDGLTLFEEYRGFMILDGINELPVHSRPSPLLRDLFVHRAEPSVHSYGPIIGLLNIHEVGPDQMNGIGFSADEAGDLIMGSQNSLLGPRIVNFNSSSSTHKVDQHGIWIHVFLDSTGLPDAQDLWGFARPPYLHGHYPLAVGQGPPYNFGRVDIYSDIINQHTGPVNEPEWHWDAGSGGLPSEPETFYSKYHELVLSTISHEVGHAVSVAHHADVPNPAIPAAPIMATVDLTDYYPQWPPDTLLGPKQSYTYELISELGVVDCVMRYNFFDCLAAISGDLDKDGVPSPWEAVDVDWVPTVPHAYRLCDGTEGLGSSHSIFWPADLTSGYTPDLCVQQIVIDDADKGW